MASLVGVQPAALMHQQLVLQPPSPPSPAQRLDAYRKVMRIFMQGSYDMAKEDALASLRSALVISEAEHQAVRLEAVAEAAAQQQQQQQQLQQAFQASRLKVEPASAEASVGHSSQPAAGAAAAAAATAPSSRTTGSRRTAAVAPAAAAALAAKAAAAQPPPRKRARAGEGGGGAAAARGGAAPVAPRAAAGPGLDIDPLVGRVVERHWPSDGGWFRGVISDYREADDMHCIVYDLGKPTESYEWYDVRGASPEDCKVTEERVDWTLLGLPAVAPAAATAPAPAAAAASKGRKTGGGAAAGGAAGSARAGSAGAAKQQAGSAAGRQAQPAVAPRQGAGATKAGASRQATAGCSKAAAARPAVARPSPPPQAAPVAAPAAPTTAQQVAPPANGRTHHAHLQNGLSRHAAAVKQALAAGGRPPAYLTGPSLLPRRTRSWSSDEESSDDDDE